MFGMLDYRAHKLYWLVMLPIRGGLKISSWATTVIVALYVGSTLTYPFLVTLFITYIAAEIISSIVVVVYAMSIGKFVAKTFLWVIDVIPAKGRDKEEALVIVWRGPIVWLGLKVGREIENWTNRDTDAFVAALGWRGRLFKVRGRIEQRIAIMRDYYERTGRQISKLDDGEMRQMLGHLHESWLMRMTDPRVLFSLVRFLVVFACVKAVHG